MENVFRKTDNDSNTEPWLLLRFFLWAGLASDRWPKKLTLLLSSADVYGARGSVSVTCIILDPK